MMKESDETTPLNESALPRYFEGQRELEIYKTWDERGVFRPEAAADQSSPVFSLTMPPPNANGELHLGHVFGDVTMDVLSRFYRARGYRVLMLPGKDHAGIQTQVVFERRLKAEGVDTRTLKREEAYQRCYDFCIDRAAYMRSQEKRIGISADWSREIFTLDPRVNKIVFETFVRMWNDGLVYRGNRIVNWSVYSQTAISDVEVEYAEAKGVLSYLRYPFAEKVSAPSPSAHVADARSFLKSTLSEERLLFVPKDSPAAKAAAGDLIEVPSEKTPYRGIVKSKLAVTLADSLWERLEEEFNVPTTNAERAAVAQAIGAASAQLLVVLPVFDNSSGLITATTRPETMLGDTALAVNPEDPRYRHLIGKKVILPLHDRPIPIIGDKRAEMSYGTGVIKVTPAHDFPDYDIGTDHKLEIRQVVGKDGKMTELAGKDFCGLTTQACREKVVAELTAKGLLVDTRTISHKVPISERGKDVIEPLISEQWWVAVDKPGLSLKKKALKLLEKIEIYPENFRHQFVQWFENLRDWNISRQLWWGHRMPVWYRKNGTDLETYVGEKAPGGPGWEQESDTFDTWFSSGQWPYSTLAACGLLDLEKPGDSAYFPTHTMVMGRDILFFWACRMILFSAYRLDEVPWKRIFFTGLIRDEHGQKMSKSKGNGIEPADMISKYGTDALRLGMIMGTTPGNDANIGEKKIEGYSKFINKIWNSAKLIEQRVSALPSDAAPERYELDANRWIAAQTARVHASVTSKLERYELSQALDELYNYTWFTYCDWYLEMLKSMAASKEPAEQRETRAAAVQSFRTVLGMLHPFIPFVTEEIYQKLPFLRTAPTLAEAPWSDPAPGAAPGKTVDEVIQMVTSVRSLKAALGIPHKVIRAAIPENTSAEAKRLITDLARVSLVAESEIAPELRLRKPFSGGVVICEVEGKAEYRKKQEKELETLKGLVVSLDKKLSGDFARRANAELVAKEREKLENSRRMAEEIESELAAM
jgi:valyl-tRNA synthetase